MNKGQNSKIGTILEISMFTVLVMIVCSVDSMAARKPVFADTLGVNESKTVTVRADSWETLTHIYVQKDKTYKFTVGSPAWNNGPIETTAAGYVDHNPLAATLRHRGLNTLALVGEVWSSDGGNSYTGTFFLIGTGRSWTATRSGYLVAIANDCPSLLCYSDNSRVVTLTIKRTA